MKAGPTVPVFTRITLVDSVLLEELAKREGIARSLYLRRLIERTMDRERRKSESK